MDISKPKKRSGRSGKSNWKQPGGFLDCNNKRKAYVQLGKQAALADETRPTVHSTNDQCPPSTATVGTQTDAPGPPSATNGTQTDATGPPSATTGTQTNELKSATVNRGVGESLWGDPFLVFGIFDVP